MFPEFNQYSTPLLIAMLAGLAFSVLFYIRYRCRGESSDLWLSLLLLIGAYRLICYTVGFMNWYDTFRNTKINYFLIDTTLLTGPLVYFYVRSATEPGFRTTRMRLLHFLPMGLYVVFRILIGLYDCLQAGFDQVQNGVLFEKLEMGAFSILISVLGYFSILLYIAFSIQVYLQHRARIVQLFSNTEQMEIRWLRNFLACFGVLFLAAFVFDFINALVMELSWKQNWWLHFLRGLALLYVGITGWRTVSENGKRAPYLAEETLADAMPQPVVSDSLASLAGVLSDYMQSRRPYLDAELSLRSLADQLQLSPVLLSQVVNQGFGKNFNDFINAYRVNAVKERLARGADKHLSLLGIAYECGFNSKATFNRAFKKQTGLTPGEFSAGATA